MSLHIFSDAITNDKVVNEGIKDENGITQDMMKNGKYIPIDEKNYRSRYYCTSQRIIYRRFTYISSL